MPSRILLIALLLLHPLAGLASASPIPRPAQADPCGAVCCCGGGACDCVAEEAPDERPAPAPALPASRAEILLTPDAPIAPSFLPPRTDPRLCRPAAPWTPVRRSLEQARLLCVWRT